MKLKSKIRNIGTSKGLIIPKQILEQSNIKNDDLVMIDIIDGNIVIEKIK